MSAATAKYGILVGVDGSAQSNAAVAWAAREAVMRQLPITLLHIVAPVVVGWPVGQLYANMTEWQKDNAQQVIEQAREALTNSLGESKPPQVHTELVFSNVVPTLIDASQQASSKARAVAASEAGDPSMPTNTGASESGVAPLPE